MGVSSADIRLRQATEQDCERLYRWRNDESVRENSFDKREIDWNAHEVWFRKALAAPEHVILIGESDAQAIGVVRCRRAGSRGYVSVVLDPASRGGGLAKVLLAAAEHWLRRHRPEISLLVAEILPQNEPSQRAFAAAGYTKRKHVYSRELKS